MIHQGNQSSTPSSFRILALDGGGIRGAFTAAFLADIEERLGAQISQYFDLIAGTSTGAIIAAALTAGEPVRRVLEFYRERGPLIFQRPSRPMTPTSRLRKWFVNKCLSKTGIDEDWLWHPKYQAQALQDSLVEVFGDRTMEDLTCSRAVIPAVDLVKGQTVVFKTPHLPGLVRDRRYRIVDVLLATTAAPTYFPHATFGIGSAFVDGGVWANNPTMLAISEALRIGKLCNRPRDPDVDLDSISVLSIGTGRTMYFAKPPAAGGGVAWWLAPLIELVSVTQAQGVSFESAYILDESYCRIDFDVPNGSWKLDSVDVVDELIHLGRAKAPELFADIHNRFLRSPTARYIPFEDITKQAAPAATCEEAPST
jgi:uncharacterized protein